QPQRQAPPPPPPPGRVNHCPEEPLRRPAEMDRVAHGALPSRRASVRTPWSSRMLTPLAVTPSTTRPSARLSPAATTTRRSVSGSYSTALYPFGPCSPLPTTATSCIRSGGGGAGGGGSGSGSG